MPKYYELSELERGQRFRAAIDSLAHLGSNVTGEDGAIALRRQGIEDEPEFPGVVLSTEDGARGVFMDPLSAVVYHIARDRSGQVPQDFIGPALTTPSRIDPIFY